MMRRRARKDANHADIVRAMRQAGASVLDLSRVGGGCPDLLVHALGQTFLVEVKDGAKRPSERKLRDNQVEFRAAWRGRVEVVETVDEALRLVTRGMI